MTQKLLTANQATLPESRLFPSPLNPLQVQLLVESFAKIPQKCPTRRAGKKGSDWIPH